MYREMHEITMRETPERRRVQCSSILVMVYFVMVISFAEVFHKFKEIVGRADFSDEF